MKSTIEERVAVLEKKVAQLERNGEPTPKKDWRRTIGMFAGDKIMKQIFEEGRKIREADRRKARDSRKKKSR